MNETTKPGLPEATPRYGKPRPKVPAFARFVGTSAWRKDRRRAREYARFRAASQQASHNSAAPGA
jgi:hypothetical protein